MLELLELQARESEERRRRSNKDFGPPTADIISAFLQLVEADVDNPVIAHSPQELTDQAEKLLTLKGDKKDPSKVKSLRIRRITPPYVEIPTTTIEIAGREIRIGLGNPARREHRYFMKESDEQGYAIDLHLIGYQISDALIFNVNGITGYGKKFTEEADIQKVSMLLSALDKAVPPKN